MAKNTSILLGEHFENFESEKSIDYIKKDI